MLIKSKGSIESRIRNEKEGRRQIRHNEDTMKGLKRTRDSVAHRGDFAFAREMNKSHRDYNRFKDPNDRKKITDEYYGRQDEAKKKYLDSQYK